jgi:uncharacterized protein with HEPN domain
MSLHDPRVTLTQMPGYAREAHEMAQARTRADLDRERMFELATMRLLEVIGEGATRLPNELRERHPDVPWASMIGVRNRLIHAYDRINHDIVWDILMADIPVVIEQLERMLDEGLVWLRIP